MQVNAAAVVLRPKAKQSRLFPHPLLPPLPGFSDRWDIPLPPSQGENTEYGPGYRPAFTCIYSMRGRGGGGAGCVMDGLPCGGGMLTVTVMHGPYLPLDRGCCIQLPFYLSIIHASGPACSWPVSGDAVPHYVDADPILIRFLQLNADLDPTFHFDGDLDLMFHFNADQNPAHHQSNENLYRQWPADPPRLHFVSLHSSRVSRHGSRVSRRGGSMVSRHGSKVSCLDSRVSRHGSRMSRPWLQVEPPWLQGQPPWLQGELPWLQGELLWLQGEPPWLQGEPAWLHF
jgi:hypothetical protein